MSRLSLRIESSIRRQEVRIYIKSDSKQLIENTFKSLCNNIPFNDNVSCTTITEIENGYIGLVVYSSLSKENIKFLRAHYKVNKKDIIEESKNYVEEVQQYTSSNTSINKNKLPASTKAIDWEQYRGMVALDIGGGSYNNLRDYLRTQYGITLHVYDKYNRSEDENVAALECKPDLVICNNVLNVIQEDSIVRSLAILIESYNVDFYVSVYEGNKSGIGSPSKKDCYQRNEKIRNYLKFFSDLVTIKNGIIRSL